MSQLVSISSPSSGREMIENAARLRRAFFPRTLINRTVPAPAPARIVVVRRPKSKRGQQQVKIADVLDAVAEHFSLSRKALVVHDRRRRLIPPRQIAMYLAREMTDCSFAQIAQLLDRDDSTVRHGDEVIALAIMDGDPIASDVEAIRARLLA